MLLVTGLGNPSARFARTRHNFGYWAVDALASDRGLSFVPGKGDYVMAGRAKDGLVLLKPTSSMNECGVPVREALTAIGATPDGMLLLSDDIDLPLGKLRFRARGGAGGHKGLESIIYALESEDFPRLRLGIATDAPMRPSEKYVLEPFRKRDQPLVTRTLLRAVEAVNAYREQGIDYAMARFHQPPINEVVTKVGEAQSS